MAKVLAYHSIPKKLLPKVLKQGVITPAITRVDPSSFDCNGMLDGLKLDALVNPETEKMFLDWVDAEVVSLSEFQRQEEFDTQVSGTQFNCWDFLAGDLELVFLSLGKWADLPFEKTGIVFDAEALVKKGAGIRRADFVVGYELALQRVLSQPYLSYESFVEKVTEDLGFVQRGQLFGDPAIEFIQDGRWKDPYEEPAELVWPGDLPVSLGKVAR